METKKLITEKSKYWKKKLIDLSKRNNLINYRFTKSKSLNIKKPDFKQIIEDLYHEKNVNILKKENEKPKERIWLCTEEEKIVEKKLTNLYLKTKENFQELGINTCFVSLGVLKYKESTDSEIYCQSPIFLFPVTINRLSSTSKDKHRFELVSGSEDLQVNPALIEKLSQDFNIDLPEFKQETIIKDYLKLFKKIISGMEDWKITEEIYIDIFYYQKYIMFRDLIEHQKLLQNSNLIKAFVGDRNALQDEISEMQIEKFDDTQDIDVLPADSSQKLAIELAKSGTTFVLQGPPGTGKSQTISNIIAALLEKKKKILFVSQKMAALNVVHKRLEEIGLGRYCLNLHNYKGNKKEIIRQLISELETSPRIKESVKRYSFVEYTDTQKEINDFYKFLCQKHQPRLFSIYDIRGELSKLHDIEIIDMPLINTISFDEEKFTKLFSKIKNLDFHMKKVLKPMENIYFNFKSSKNTTLSRNNFKKLIDETHQILKEILEFIKEINSKTDLKITNLNELEIFCEFHKNANKLKDIPDFLISNKFEEYKKLIYDLHKNLNEINNIKSEILKKVKENFIEEKTEKQEKILRETSFLAKIFNKEYKIAKLELKSFSKEKLSHNNWIKLFELKKNYKKALNRFEKIKTQNKKNIKKLGKINSIKNLENLKIKIEQFSQTNKNAEKLINKPAKILNFWLNEKNKKYLCNNLNEKLRDIDSYLIIPIMKNNKDIEELKKQIYEFIEHLHHLDIILIFKEEYNSLDKEIKEFIKKYFKENIISKLSSVFLKSYYLQLLEEILKENNISSPKNKIEIFKDKDFEVRDIKRFKIMDIIEQNQPSVNYSSHGINEVSILKRENQKKRKLKPIRNLLENIPNLVFSLKPCFMMSPLSVSKYINPNSIKFDVVIFDEASQIMSEDAVPCLIRAKQAIVVGDTQQLPPTSFFMSGREDEIVEEEIEDLESFLSECSTKFRTKSLLWHYRSQNEHLIAFSNRFFYEHKLITFPNSKIKDESGLDFVYIKTGVYDRGKSRKNRIEAREVVKKYQEIKKNFPSKSIGIIAFSIAQENAIREEFRIARINIEESIDSFKEDLFIKNLETVQGDERDIILISIGYGKDSSNKLSYHFGPLNREGGYKRLNVAITRSRFKTVVLSSISPEELDEDKINVDGVKFLKYYLDYAKNKNFNRFLQTIEGLNFDSNFEESVYEALTKEGFLISSQVGCSGYKIDLAIKHPKKIGVYILGIECDGAQYHSSRFARDRDKVRQLILENLGWNIHRIWSDDWLNNREYEIKKIKERIDYLLKTKNNSTKKELKFEKVENVEDFKEISLKEKYEKYKVAELSESRTEIEFDNYGDMIWGKDEAKQLMLFVLEVESPIEKELLYKRTLASFGINKLGARLKRNFDNLINEIKNEYQNIYIYGETVSIGKIDNICPVKISKENQRPFTLIPKEEIGGAIVDILKNTFGATKETLIADIAKGIFHNNRIGEKIKEKIEEAIKHLEKKEIIKSDNGKIFLVNK